MLVRNKPFSSEEQVRMYLGRAIGNAAFERYKGMKRERLRHMPVDEQVLKPAEQHSPYDCMEQAERWAEREVDRPCSSRIREHVPSKQYEALRLTILESRGSSIRMA